MIKIFPLDYFKLEPLHFENFKNTPSVNILFDENKNPRCKHSYEKLTLASSCVKTSCCNYVFLEEPLIKYLSNPIVNNSCPNCSKFVNFETRNSMIQKIKYMWKDTFLTSFLSFGVALLSAKVTSFVFSKLINTTTIYSTLGIVGFVSAIDIKNNIVKINNNYLSNFLIASSVFALSSGLDMINKNFSKIVQGLLLFLPLKKSQDLIKATTILSLFKFSQILYNDYGLSKGLGNISALILSSFIGTYSSDKLTKKALNKTALKSVNNFSEFFSYFGAFIGIKGNLVFYKFLDSTTITLTTIGVGYCLNKDS